MMMGWNRFNIYLLPVLALGLVCGCQNPERQRKRQLSTLRVHLEAPRDGTKRSEPVPISRDDKVMVNVEKSPFLTEASVSEAKIVDTVGGFALSIEFDRQGSWLLEQYSTANRGKHFAIFSRFVPETGQPLNEGRWLAAPLIPRGITNGVLFFTPDATREEAGQIVLGLNNIAQKLKADAKWW